MEIGPSLNKKLVKICLNRVFDFARGIFFMMEVNDKPLTL